MTEEEIKAKELVEKFEKIFIDANADSWGKEAKQCALIHVNGVIDVLGSAGVFGFADDKVSEEWESIKTEIEKL